ncbi:MAG: hypothetical protein AB1813_03895 [Verrucomicrobiota bacterium]
MNFDFVILIPLAALIAAGLVMRNRSPRLAPWFLATGSAGCLIVVGWLFYRELISAGPSGPDRPQAAVAYILGQQAARELIGKSGTVGIILSPKMFSAETLDSQYDTFARVLLPFPDLSFKEITLKSSARAVREGTVPREDFEKLLSEETGMVAYVSFAGVPANVHELPPLQQKNPAPWFVYDPSGSTHWMTALQRGLIRAVAVPKPGMAGAKAERISGSPEEIFRKQFELITPESDGVRK